MVPRLTREESLQTGNTSTEEPEYEGPHLAFGISRSSRISVDRDPRHSLVI